MCKKPQWLQLVLRGLFRGPETLHEGVGNVSTTFKFPEGSKKNLKRPDSRILSKSWLKMPFENPFSKPHRTSKGTLIELNNSRVTFNECLRLTFSSRGILHKRDSPTAPSEGSLQAQPAAEASPALSCLSTWLGHELRWLWVYIDTHIYIYISMYILSIYTYIYISSEPLI